MQNFPDDKWSACFMFHLKTKNSNDLSSDSADPAFISPEKKSKVIFLRSQFLILPPRANIVLKCHLNRQRGCRLCTLRAVPHFPQGQWSKLPVSDVQLVESELNCTRRAQKENEGKKIIKRGDLFRPIFPSSIFASALLSERVEQAMERGNTRARETETRHPLGRWHASPLLLSLVAIFARFNWGTTRNLLFTFRITGNKWRSAASASVRLRETHINLSCGVAACFLIKQCEVNIELMFVFPVSRVLFSLVFGGEKSPGVLPYKSDGGARRKISRTPIKATSNLVFRACPKFISTPKRYQFNNNKLYNWHCKF